MKDVRSQLDILDEIMKLCDSAAVKPLKKTSIKAVIAPDPKMEEDGGDDEASEDPLEKLREASSSEDEESEEGDDVKSKLDDLDVEELLKLYSKLK